MLFLDICYYMRDDFPDSLFFSKNSIFLRYFEKYIVFTYKKYKAEYAGRGGDEMKRQRLVPLHGKREALAEADFSLDTDFGERLLSKIQKEKLQALDEEELTFVNAAGAPRKEDFFRGKDAKEKGES